MLENKVIYESLLRKSQKKIKNIEERIEANKILNCGLEKILKEELEVELAKEFSYKLSIDIVNDIWYLS